jgi:hypothetical protein
MNSRRRRLGFVLAAAIAALAVAIAAYPLIQPGGSGEYGWPGIIPRPVFIAALLGLPAGLAAIAVFRGSRPIFIAAGVVCLLQSIVGALSGVTLGFLIPGILLLVLGLERTTTASPPTRRRAWLGGVLVVALAIAAWVAPFATTETVCWTAQKGADDPVYTRIPETDTLGVGTGDLASGCDSGVFTLEGLLLAGVLAIGALAIAGLAAGSGDRPRDGESAPG